jgi:DHA2 family multidrug resistance protein-like MFS transporter
MSSPGAAQVGAAAPPDGLPVPRRYWAIAAIILSICMSVLDATIANVALPSIARDFHATKAASIWIINAYQLAILATLLPLASLGEIVGYRRVSQAGMVVFTLASLGCAFSTSLLTMSIASVIQGLGAAGGMLSTARLVGQTLGAAGVALLFRAYPASGSNVALLIAAGISFVAALVSVSRVTTPHRA